MLVCYFLSYLELLICNFFTKTSLFILVYFKEIIFIYLSIKTTEKYLA